MAANVYEAMFILDSNRYGRDPEGVSGQIPGVIQKLGGEILISRLWEQRRLAYPIKGQRKGTYWLTYFRLDRDHLATVRRECQINENLLRFLFLKVDPQLVDTLVAHAQAAPLVVATVPAEAEEEVVVLAEGEEDLELPAELEEDV
ncbi:MAG: 30S ribosomal protein S6 [Thermoguttaceae bacterium]